MDSGAQAPAARPAAVRRRDRGRVGLGDAGAGPGRPLLRLHGHRVVDHRRELTRTSGSARAGNESFEFASPFDERTYYKVASVPGVERAERVLINFAQFKLADGGDLGVQIVGIEHRARSRAAARAVERVAGDAQRLAEPGAIVDRQERVSRSSRSITSATRPRSPACAREVVAMTQRHPVVHDLADRVHRPAHRAQLPAAARRRRR